MTTETETSTDAITREIVVRAPRARVWRALTDSQEFGRWFRARLSGPFVAGERALGRVAQPGYEHLTFEVFVERMEPERLFSWRWHPYPADPQRDYSQEPTTLVVFELEDVPEGTRVRVTESGFDRIPLERRAEAFRMNAQGWAQQVENLAEHVGQPG
jgi:uncharacterized protein YndB with AHSA1/START domain